MRLRHIAGAAKVVHDHQLVVNNPENYIGKWNQVFEDVAPIHIEIGMGKGQFIIKKALENPRINYIGIERYASVLLRALERLDEQVDRRMEGEGVIVHWPPANLRFICMDANEISGIFGRGEVSKIYLNFSDPWPKGRHSKRRLTSVEFLQRYQQILWEQGKLEFKTDNVDLFEFSLWQIKKMNWQLELVTKDLHQDQFLSQGNIMTEYEEKFLGEGVKICKLRCRPQ